MRKLLLLIAVIVCAFDFTNAQTVFNKTHYADRPSMRFSSVTKNDTLFCAIGVTVNKQPPYYEQALFVKLNAAGEILSYKAYPDTVSLNTGLFWNTLSNVGDSGYAFSGYGFDTTQHLIFGFLNGYFDSVKLYRYYTPNTFAFQGIKFIQHNAKDFYVTGVHTENLPGNSNVVLVKIDANGSRVWERYYDTGKYNYAQSIFTLNNGNLLIGAERNDRNNTNEKSNTWLLEVDTGGNIVRQWFDPNDSTYVAEGLRQTQDGGFIYGAQKKVYQVNGSLGFNATVVKMDSNFNKQWTFEGGVLGNYTGVVDIELLPDGGYIACGNYSNKEAWVIKFTEAGDVVWLRKYIGLTDTTATWNLLSDIDILPDGGLIAVGQCQRIINPNNLTPQVGWFLKLDSNGCEVENCLVGVEEPSANFKGQSKILVWPNPFTNDITVTLPEQWQNEKVLLSVCDVFGQTIFEKENYGSAIRFIDTREFSSGLYFVTAKHNGIQFTQKILKE